MDTFLYSEVSHYFPDSSCSGAHCTCAGWEKLQSGWLVALYALQLLTYIGKSSRLCKDVLRCDAIPSEAAVGKPTHHVLWIMCTSVCMTWLTEAAQCSLHSPESASGPPFHFCCVSLLTDFQNEHTKTAPARHIFTPPMKKNNAEMWFSNKQSRPRYVTQAFSSGPQQSLSFWFHDGKRRLSPLTSSLSAAAAV